MLVDKLGVRHVAKRFAQFLSNGGKNIMSVIRDHEEIAISVEQKRVTISPAELFGENINQSCLIELLASLAIQKIHVASFRVNNFNHITFSKLIKQIHILKALNLYSARS